MDGEEAFDEATPPCSEVEDTFEGTLAQGEDTLDAADEEREAFIRRYGMTPEKFREWKESLEIYKDHPEQNPYYYVHPPIEVLEQMERDGLL
jgi:hypothetical protein